MSVFIFSETCKVDGLLFISMSILEADIFTEIFKNWTTKTNTS